MVPAGARQADSWVIPQGPSKVEASIPSELRGCCATPILCYAMQGTISQCTSERLLDLICRDEAGEESLVVNFDTDLRSTFFAKLYQHSGLRGGHVIMLGADEGSRLAIACLSTSWSLITYYACLRDTPGVSLHSERNHVALLKVRQDCLCTCLIQSHQQDQELEAAAGMLPLRH